ncbi:MAG TPA: hypothetical protein VMF52_11125 [Steroidobacteraceae bacterium]|nr:hypothetical protein [Steroidobacteraceae bacterium]
MNRILLGALASAAAFAMSACETSNSAGTGSGNVRGSTKPVAFTWESSGNDSGNITATFGTGRVFRGKYFQITSDTRAERLDPLWDGWERSSRRGSWRYWERDPGPGFAKTYSGRVLANLHSEDGEHMRCRFTLISPARGMTGGGAGRCEMSESRREINAEFPRQ